MENGKITNRDRKNRAMTTKTVDKLVGKHTIVSPCAMPPIINLYGSFPIAGGGGGGNLVK